MTKTFSTALLVLLSFTAACNRDPNVAKQRYLESGNKYYSNGKYKEALIMYRNALKRDLKFGEAYYRSALAELQLQRFPDAARDLQRAVELQPNNQDAHDKLSDLFLNVYMADRRRPKQMLEELRSLADKYAKRFPNSYAEQRLRGYLSLFDGDGESALKYFEKANQLKPHQPDLVMVYMQALRNAGKAAEAEKLGLDLLAKKPDAMSVYDVLYLQYRGQNRAADAEELLRRKVQNNQNAPEAHLQLAAHYFTSKQPDKMTAALQPVESDQKKFPKGLMQVGDFFARIRQYDQAASRYRSGAEKIPADKHAYQKRLIEVLVKQEKHDEANRLVEEILKADPKDSEATAIRASLSLLNGDKEHLQKAIDDLQTVISRIPDNPVIRYNLGRALLAKGSTDAARIQFEEAVKLRPDYVLPRITLAQMLLQKHEYGKVLQMTQEILVYDPDNIAAHLLRTRALFQTGEAARARSELVKTVERFPTLPEARLQMAALDLHDRKYGVAEEAFRKLYGELKDPRALMGLVDTQMAQGKSGDALRLLRDELARAPERLEYRMAIAAISAATGDHKTAITEYQKILEKQPQNPDVWLQLSEAQRQNRDVQAALASAKKAQELAPTSAVAQLQTAMLFDTNGRQPEAKPYYEKALRLQPDNPIALNNLAYLLAESGNDLDQALTMAQKAKQQRPNDPNISDTLGWVYIRKNLPDSAIAIYRDLVEKHPGRATYHYHLAVALNQKGDKAQAKRYCELALKANPDPSEAGKIRDLMSKLG